MSVFEECFEKGQGVRQDNALAVVVSICALADEVRALREVQQKRLDILEAETALRTKSGDQMEQILSLQREALKPKYPVTPALGTAKMVRPVCCCGHPLHSHDESGCIACECQTFQEFKS